MTFRSITPGLVIGALALCSSGSIIAQSAPATGDKVTVAGCLQRAQRNGSVGGTIVGTSASPNTAPQEANSGALVDAYLLSEARPVVAGVPQTPADPSAPGSTTGAAAATGTSGKA